MGRDISSSLTCPLLPELQFEEPFVRAEAAGTMCSYFSERVLDPNNVREALNTSQRGPDSRLALSGLRRAAPTPWPVGLRPVGRQPVPSDNEYVKREAV